MSQATFSKKETIGLYLLYALAVILVVSVGIAMALMTSDVFGSSKGLKVYLDVESNQRPQEACITTYQFGRIAADCTYYFINQGHTSTTLTYESGQIQNGEFKVCVRLNDGLENCGNGYNGEAKKPENVSVNLQRSFTPVDNTVDPQSQSQSSSNENNNALSQSQTTQVIICTDGDCKVQ